MSRENWCRKSWTNRCHIFFFFFNDTATTEIYTLSLHDALPISGWHTDELCRALAERGHTGRVLPYEGLVARLGGRGIAGDRKSTRLNSSHLVISYAVFCLKKKNRSNATTQYSLTSRSSYNPSRI